MSLDIDRYKCNIPDRKKEEETRVIKETTALSLALYISQFTLGVRGFFIARILGPTLYGLWSVFHTAIALGAHLGLGTSQAMRREVPFNKGKNKQQDNITIFQNSFTFQLLVSLSVCVILLALSQTNLIGDLKTEFRLLGFVLILNNTFFFLTNKLNGEKKIYSYAVFSLLYSLMNTLFGISLIFCCKINGLFIGMIISHAILLSASLKKRYLYVGFQIKLKVIKELIKIGFPIMILNLSSVLMKQIDKLLVFTFLGRTMAGYYGLAAFISILVQNIPNSISNVLFPRMMQKYGRTNRKEDIENYFLQPITIIANSMPIILGMVFIFSDAVILMILPKYAPALTIIKILILSLFFTSILRVPTDILILFNKQKRVMYIQIAFLILGGLFDYIAIREGFGIEGVALATAFIFFVFSVVLIVYALSSFGKTVSSIIMQLICIYAPFFYATLILIIAKLTVRDVESVFQQSLLMSMLFLLFVIPLINNLNRYGIFKKILYVVINR
ncbi:oligosaccharide flippase family protein [candidate division KSB1 bacterium]|nr:oligosaccharide flippase family protein [candidate division KSB1 bacterium]